LTSFYASTNKNDLYVVNKFNFWDIDPWSVEEEKTNFWNIGHG
jgi:hypothetical protein